MHAGSLDQLLVQVAMQGRKRITSELAFRINSQALRCYERVRHQRPQWRFAPCLMHHENGAARSSRCPCLAGDELPGPRAGSKHYCSSEASPESSSSVVKSPAMAIVMASGSSHLITASLISSTETSARRFSRSALKHRSRSK